MNTEEKKHRTIAIVLTAVVYAAVIAALFLVHLSTAVTDDAALNADEAKTEIAFDGEEYVQMGDIPEPDHNDGEPASADESDDEAASDGEDQTNEGTPADGQSLVSTKKESAMETTKKKKTGPTEAELKKQQEEQARIKKEKEQQEKEKNKINNRAQNAFNRTSSGSGSGQSGSPDGNSSTGALSGTPGHNLGSNYRLSAQKFSCAKSGTLRFSITVRQDGTVTSVKYTSGSGEAASDLGVRRQFEQRTKNLRFTVSGENIPEEKRGVITWSIK